MDAPSPEPIMPQPAHMGNPRQALRPAHPCPSTFPLPSTSHGRRERRTGIQSRPPLHRVQPSAFCSSTAAFAVLTSGILVLTAALAASQATKTPPIPSFVDPVAPPSLADTASLTASQARSRIAQMQSNE